DAEIYALYVLQSHQQRGVGRALVRACARHFVRNGLFGFYLWVLKANRARLFYEALGGEVVGERTEKLGRHDFAEIAYGWRYDTAHGKFPGKVEVDGDHMVVNGDRIRVVAQRDPAQLPWKDLGVDVVLECTGFFTTKEKASAHIKGGAKKVIISAPGGKDVD